VNLLSYLKSARAPLSHSSRNVLDILLSDSPLSTKQLKAAAELEGRYLEANYNRAMKPLWSHLLILGFGEFEDSSFPSLGIGASQLLFEELWSKSLTLDPKTAEKYLIKTLHETNPFWKYALKIATADAVDQDAEPATFHAR